MPDKQFRRCSNTGMHILQSKKSFLGHDLHLTPILQDHNLNCLYSPSAVHRNKLKAHAGAKDGRSAVEILSGTIVGARNWTHLSLASEQSFIKMHENASNERLHVDSVLNRQWKSPKAFIDEILESSSASNSHSEDTGILVSRQVLLD